ncbi:MAG TPA: DUF4118 domain-containing protein, partial [Gemmatimonadaceae bacterium]|nr:DUF4118 domain-containing protein [Gemmatimonadaceae bacterium]
MASKPPTRILGAISAGRARASWRWQTVAAIVPPLVAFVIQWYFLRPTMARWALFYPAVFISAWFGGVASGLAATAVSSAIVSVLFIPHPAGALHRSSNVMAAAMFAVMSIAISIVLERLRRLVGQLEESRQWLQAIMDYSPNVIVIKDLAGRYLRVNRRLGEIVNLPPDSVRGRTDQMLFSTDVADYHRRTDLDAIQKCAPITYEETI